MSLSCGRTDVGVEGWELVFIEGLEDFQIEYGGMMTKTVIPTGVGTYSCTIQTP
jgi:hypothetical protein